MRHDFAALAALLVAGCGEEQVTDEATLPVAHHTPDAFVGIGQVDPDAAFEPADARPPRNEAGGGGAGGGGAGGSPAANDAGEPPPEWAAPLKLDLVEVPHDAPILRATEIAFFPGGSPDFLWLDKDGDVLHMRLERDRARRLGSFRVEDTWMDSDAGLLSAAFDPDFANNGFFYLGVSVGIDRNLIRRYHWTPGDYAATGSSGRLVLEVTGERARRSWHNIGSIGFTETGDLWALFGDKTLGEPAQDPASPLGALLRVRPSHGPEGGYEPSPDNPYSAEGGHPAVYAKGMRSPWKGLYHEGRWFFGDVGQDQVEEVNLIDAPGQNFGWPRAEGPCETDCEGLTEPWVSFGRGSGHRFVAEDPDAEPSRLRAVYVGWIYRTDLPGAENDPYLGRWRDVLTFGDMCTGFIRARRTAPGAGEADWAAGHLHYATAWAQAPDGYVYLTALGTWPADSPDVKPSPLYRAVLRD